MAVASRTDSPERRVTEPPASYKAGEKFEVPFDTLVIFSTNFHPNEIFDKAALRRIFFKIKIDGPNQEDFLKIFAMVARKRNGAKVEDPIKAQKDVVEASGKMFDPTMVQGLIQALITGKVPPTM